MKGYLYREWKLNRLIYFISVIIAMVTVFLPLVIVMFIKETISREAYLYYAGNAFLLQTTVLCLGMTAALGLQEYTFFRNEDHKDWGLFVVSNPKGIYGYMISKYIFTAFICISYYLITLGFDYILSRMVTVIGGVGIAPRCAEITWIFLFMLFANALEMPFVILFGVKKGNIVKLSIGISVIMLMLFFLMANPFGITQMAVDFFVKYTNMEVTLSLNWYGVLITVGLYFLSCLISCKLYLRGVFKNYQ